MALKVRIRARHKQAAIADVRNSPHDVHVA